MVSVLHKELEYKVEKLKYKKVGGHAAENQNQMRTSSWWINHHGSVHIKFNSCDWLLQSIILLVKNDKEEGRGGLKERGGLLETRA